MTVGPYRVLHQLGAGVLGPVFRAHDTKTEALVAIKLFRLDATPEQARELAAGLEVLCARLPRHPCIVTPLAAGLDGSAAWLAEDYVAADTLDARLKRRSAGGLRAVLPLLSQIAEALDAAADASIRHGALHPRDILVSTRLDVRMTGFGIAEALEALGLAAPVRRPYTAPERANGGAWARQADIFSLGVLAFEMLTGRRPVGHGASAAGLVSGVGEGVDADACRHALGRALAERASDRFEQGREFIEALVATLGEPVDLRAPRQREERVAAPLLLALDEDAALERAAETVTAGAVVPTADAPVPLRPAEGTRRPERVRGARTSHRAAAPPALSPIPFDVEDTMPDTPEPPAPTTPVVDPLPEGPLPAVAPRWDEPRQDVAEGTEDGGGALTGLPAGWRETLVARPGILAGALVAGVLIGLAGGYALWGGRPGASAPPPTPTATPATSSKQGVTEPALNVAVPPQPAPRTEAPPVPREAADPPARPATAAPTAVRTAPREVSTAPRAATTAQRGAPARAAVPPPPVTPASLEVASRPPGARVVVDGRVAGKTPLRLDKVAAGPHTVRLELEGYAPWATTVTLTAGQAARVAGSLERVQR